MKFLKILIISLLGALSLSSYALRLEPIKYGDFSNWVTREVSESKMLGGKKKTIYTVGESKLFEGLGDSFQAARYHSLAAVRDKLPEVLRVTAEAEDGEIMAVEHTEYPIYGVQFHPESVMTLDGKKMVENFINVVRV